MLAVVLIAQATGSDGTPWLVGGLLTPATVAVLFLTGFIVRGKSHEETIARVLAAEQRERERAERSEEREREVVKLALPALAQSNLIMDRVLQALPRGPS